MNKLQNGEWVCPPTSWIMSSNFDVFGLKYIFSSQGLIPEGDDRDWIFPDAEKHIIHHPTKQASLDVHFDKSTVEDFTREFLNIKNGAKCIFEIGMCIHSEWVETPQEHSSTYIMLNNKDNNTIYIGMDLRSNMLAISDATKNIHVINENSSNHHAVYKLMDTLGIDEFDFIFIDGNHSINQTISDWKYVEKLKVGGVVGLHDANYHPGPHLLYSAIDENYFEKRRCGIGWSGGWGLEFATRIK